MKFMKRRNLRLFAVAALLPFMAVDVPAQSNKAAVQMSAAESAISQQLTQVVRSFLANVPKGDRQTFENFFADDVIYTRSAGVTVDKAEILRNIDVHAVNEPKATYEADDFTVHPYGNMAVVNFRLMQHNEKDGKQETHYFRNTGTFLKRNGKWQVVAWQATKIPESGEAK
jgi:ketosteroid isomerase-like protein